jgi:hypothetical protein
MHAVHILNKQQSPHAINTVEPNTSHKPSSRTANTKLLPPAVRSHRYHKTRSAARCQGRFQRPCGISRTRAGPGIVATEFSLGGLVSSRRREPRTVCALISFPRGFLTIRGETSREEGFPKDNWGSFSSEVFRFAGRCTNVCGTVMTPIRDRENHT